MFACSRSIDPEPVAWIPAQSPAAGEPDPVDPPTLLSLIDVNVIGDPDVPLATSDPSTEIEPPRAPGPCPLTIVPGASVSVAPLGTSSTALAEK